MIEQAEHLVTGRAMASTAPTAGTEPPATEPSTTVAATDATPPAPPRRWWWPWQPQPSASDPRRLAELDERLQAARDAHPHHDVRWLSVR